MAQAMTAFAQAALAVSDLVGVRFAKTRFSGATTRIVKVQPPNVPSTGGGKQARESVNLVPEGGDGPVITCGFIDVGLRACEIRSYAALNVVSKERTGKPLDIPQPEYETFLKEFGEFLGSEGFVVKIVEGREQAQKAALTAREKQQASEGGSRTIVIAAAVVIGLIVAAAAVMLTR